MDKALQQFSFTSSVKYTFHQPRLAGLGILVLSLGDSNCSGQSFNVLFQHHFIPDAVKKVWNTMQNICIR